VGRALPAKKKKEEKKGMWAGCARILKDLTFFLKKESKTKKTSRFLLEKRKRGKENQ